jgi:hypothetical protein
MKKVIIFTGLIFTIAVVLISCYKDVILPDPTLDPDAPAQAVSFKNEIQPMVNAKCAISGCHISNYHKPYMTPAISYQEIVNGGFVNTLFPKESIMYKKINGEMKEYIPSAVDRQKIYDWIRTGALNN